MGSRKSMKRLENIDILRGISIIGVVLIHVISILGGVEAGVWHIVYLGLTRYCVPMFFVCMGAILLQKDRELNIHKLYTKNIPRFLIAIFLLPSASIISIFLLLFFFMGSYIRSHAFSWDSMGNSVLENCCSHILKNLSRESWNFPFGLCMR